MPSRFTLNPAESRFTVQAFATGMLSGFAHSPTFNIPKFDGEVRLKDDGSLDAVSIAVVADSLTLTDRLKESDREEITRAMKEEVLEVSRYPRIEFASTQIESTQLAPGWLRAVIRGDMNLHGVSRSLTIDTQVRVNSEQLRLSGEFQLSQSAFNIKRVSAAAGMIKVKDELKFTFDLVGAPAQ